MLYKDIALVWVLVLWPLLVGLGIAALFRARLSRVLDPVWIVVVVYGLQGMCSVPLVAARLVLLVNHSPSWVDSNEILSYGHLAADLIALLVALVLSGRIASWVGARNSVT